MNACLDCVHGTSGFWSGVGDFLGSSLGQALVGAGVSIGTAYAIQSLDLGPQAPRGGQMSGGSSVNPAGSIYNPTAQAQPGYVLQQPQQASGATPSWMLPAAIGFGALLLILEQ